MRVKLSVIVSTYNRSTDLRRLLESLRPSPATARWPWELIVVDNNSRDDTAQVIADFQAQAPFPVRGLFEARQGKSFALNTGLAVAVGDIVAFTDDDIIVSPDWVENIIRHFETHGDAACVGGMVTLFNPQDDPVCIRTTPDAARITIETFSAAHIPIMGCNMAMPAGVLRAIGPFDTDLGPGSRIGVAEDLDLLYRLVRQGHAIEYVPAITVSHNHGRRGGRGLHALRKNYLTGRGAFYWKHASKGDKLVARWAYWELRYLIGWHWLQAVFRKAARDQCADALRLVLGALRYVRYRRRVAMDSAETPGASRPQPTTVPFA